MVKDRKELPSLSGLERVVLGVLWDLGEANAADVTEAIQKQRKLALTTVHTVLSNLIRKGWVKRAPRTERAYVFKPTVSREEAGRRSLREIISSVFSGSVEDAVLCMLRDEKLTEEERIELWRRVMEEQRKGEGP